MADDEPIGIRAWAITMQTNAGEINTVVHAATSVHALEKVIVQQMNRRHLRDPSELGMGRVVITPV